MIKKFFIIFFIFFLNSNITFSSNNIFFLDLDFILNNSDRGKAILSKLDSINKKNINEIKIIEQNLINENEEINKIKNVISKEELEKKIALLQKNIESFNTKKKELGSSFNQLREDEFNQLMSDIRPIIEIYMNENSIDFLLNKKDIFIAKSDKNITSELLNLINNNLK